MTLPKPQKLVMIVGLSFLSQISPAQELFPDSSKISTSITTLNSDYLEFSPVFYRDGLLFVTSKKKKKKRYFDIAYSIMDKEGHLGTPQFFKTLNTEYHEGPLAVTNQGRTVFITRSDLESGKPISDSLGLNRLDIYEVTLTEEGATEKKLSFHSKDYCHVHPTLTQDATIMYFASDRPGGYGGFDIWYSQKEGEKWGTPVNLGPSINTSKNELFPYIFQDSLLFFASNRPVDGQPKGLDIYLCRLHRNHCVKPLRRLPAPINSASDDFGLILDTSRTFGFFSSNRAGTDDIYEYHILAPTPSPKKQLLLKVLENTPLSLHLSTDQPVQGADISILKGNDTLFSAKTNSKGLVTFELTPHEKYEIVFSKEPYEPFQLTLTDSSDFNQTIWVEKKKAPCLKQHGFVSKMDHTQPLEKVNVVVIPDIDSSLTITTVTDKNGQFSFCLPENSQSYELMASKSGYMTFDTRLTIGQSADVFLLPIENGLVKQTIVLENIYYDFNDSRIKESSAEELLRLAQILKQHPEINILLVAYTDSRGSKKYNERLARHRARAAKAFLVKQGIAANRIKPVGRGEVNIRNRCKNGVDCSEEEHQYNRRTEVIFRNNSEELQLVRKSEL